MGCSKSSSKREVYRDTNLPPETRKKSNSATLHLLQVLDKGEQTKTEVSRRKEVIKIRAEINEIETKTKRSIKLRAGSSKIFFKNLINF